MSKEPTLRIRRIYKGHVVGLRIDTVELPDGRTTQREIVEHSESVSIIPVDSQGNVLLVRQYRKPAERVLLEVPAGGVEPGEKPEETVIRELQEETGHTAQKIERIGAFYISPGYSTELMHLYLATQLIPSSLEADIDEKIEVVRVPLSRISEMIRQGEIQDSKSIAGLLMVLTERDPRK
ncbi:MAG: NUDIX hydrolase [Chloroflexi bacterium]|nr:NUDIX hydrolase [Chloroflexota bacterium]